MNEQSNELLNTLKEGLASRFSDPIISTFIVSFLITNYDVILIMFDSDIKFYTKVDYIHEAFSLIYKVQNFDPLAKQGWLNLCSNFRGWHALRYLVPAFFTYILLFQWPKRLHKQLLTVAKNKVNIENGRIEAKAKLLTIQQKINEEVSLKTKNLEQSITKLEIENNNYKTHNEELKTTAQDSQNEIVRLNKISGEFDQLNKEYDRLLHENMKLNDENKNFNQLVIDFNELNNKNQRNEHMIKDQEETLQDYYKSISLALPLLKKHLPHEQTTVREQLKQELNRIYNSKYTFISRDIENRILQSFDEGLTRVYINQNYTVGKQIKENFSEFLKTSKVKFVFKYHSNLIDYSSYYELIYVDFSEFISEEKNESQVLKELSFLMNKHKL